VTEHTGSWHKLEGFWVRTALLIQSIRTPEGPRHQYLGSLGMIREGREQDWPEQWEFWEKTERGLDKAKVDGAERRKIEAKLAEVVPRPKPIKAGRKRKVR
jgi:hypothetical protein